MKTVKRLEPETILESAIVNSGQVGFKTGRGISYGIFEGDKIIKRNGQYEIYRQKSTAEKQAGWLNSHV